MARAAFTYRANNSPLFKRRGEHPHIYDRATWRCMRRSAERFKAGRWPGMGDANAKASAKRAGVKLPVLEPNIQIDGKLYHASWGAPQAGIAPRTPGRSPALDAPVTGSSAVVGDIYKEAAKRLFRPLTPEQRARKQAADRARRAKQKVLVIDGA